MFFSYPSKDTWGPGAPLGLSSTVNLEDAPPEVRRRLEALTCGSHPYEPHPGVEAREWLAQEVSVASSISTGQVSSSAQLLNTGVTLSSASLKEGV